MQLVSLSHEDDPDDVKHLNKEKRVINFLNISLLEPRKRGKNLDLKNKSS
jgi:hypothetical protein